MKLVVVRTEIKDDVKVILLFVESSGLLLGLYYVSANSVIEKPQRIWLIDLTENNELSVPQNSLAHLMKNVCAN